MRMASLCYPYGSGITCVCDEGRIYKCFPDLKSEAGQPPGGGGAESPGDIITSLETHAPGLDRR